MSDLPDLSALRSGDSAAWDQLFNWLYPIALSAAGKKLYQILPGDAEDVAVEALELLVPKVQTVKVVEELRPLVASITYCLAVDRLRQHFSKKRGGGRVGSLDEDQDGEGGDGGPRSKDDPENEIRNKELAQLISGLMRNLKPQARALLSDFFLHGKPYDELSGAYGLAKNSIGVYLKRGLDAIRDELAQQPKLAGELRTLLALPARVLGLLLSFV